MNKFRKKPKLTMDGAILKFRTLREAVEREDAAYKERMKPAKDMLAKLERYMLKLLNEQGQDSAQCTHGTAYKKRHQRLKVENWEDFLKWVQEEDAFAMLDKRPNKTTVLEHQKEHGKLPPGLGLSTEVVVNVNKPTARRS